MEKVKVQNKKTKVIKYVNKNIATDYLATKEWELVKEETKNKFSLSNKDE